MTDDTTPIEQPLDSERLNIPYFFTLERYDQCRALESLIFASEEPLTTRVMHRILVLEDPTNEHPGQQPLPLDGEPAEADTAAPLPVFEIPKGYFDELVDDINTDLERTDRPFRIVKIAGGYQFATTPQHGSLVQRLLKARNRKRLTQAALETLAIYEDDGLIERAAKMGAYMNRRIEEMKALHPSIGDWRNTGLLGCLELVKSRSTKEPMAPFNAKPEEMAVMNQVAAKIKALGMYTFVRWSYIFIGPPLIITEEQIEEGLAIISEALQIADAAVTV